MNCTVNQAGDTALLLEGSGAHRVPSFVDREFTAMKRGEISEITSLAQEGE